MHQLMIGFLLVGHAAAQEPQEAADTTERDGRTFTIRENGMPPAGDDRGFVSLLPARGLEGWRVVGGDAVIDRDEGDLHGRGNSARNTFLMSERTFGDFILEGEVMINANGNSGWQVRSHQPKPGVRNSGVRGYQLEVDSSQRSWSGGLYDELRRGWIHSLADDEAARNAFKAGEWNHYRIECHGPHVRSWVNGVPCADVIDFADMDGMIAFQVHSGNCDVRWKDLRVLDNGTSSFVPMKTWRGQVGVSRHPDGSIVVRSGGESAFIDTPLGGANTTIRLSCDLDGRAVMRLHPEDTDTNVVVFDLSGESSKTSSPVTGGVKKEEIRYPVVSEGAGSDSSDSKGEHELIIDVEGRRLTVILDGSVLHRVILEKTLLPKRLEIEIPPGSGGITLHEAHQIKHTPPVMRN
ncbi:MAG: DUF1080 domain-containing protein [Phycisphaerales bacterium]|nr:DUF1080 domain-containing protein [Phycisphaerales bacterium]